MRASIVIVLACLAACQPAGALDDPSPPPSGRYEPAPPPPLEQPQPTLRQRPTELRAAADLAGVFPVPEGARFQRRAGRVGVYRLAASLDQAVRFYRRAGFTVLEKPRGATVTPQAQTREQELLVLRPLFGDVVQLIVYQGGGGESP